MESVSSFFSAEKRKAPPPLMDVEDGLIPPIVE